MERERGEKRRGGKKGSAYLCIMAWRSRSAAVEPTPLADMAVRFGLMLGSRGMARVDSVGMALDDLWAIWRGLGLGRPGEVGYSELRVTSAGRVPRLALALGLATATSTRCASGLTWAKLAEGDGNWNGPASVIVIFEPRKF
jgi:hypothetical protein